MAFKIRMNQVSPTSQSNYSTVRTTNLVTSVQTTEGGAFSLEGAFPSNVFLRVVLPSGFLVTDRDQGTDENLDSDFDPITGSTHCFTINCTNATSTNCTKPTGRPVSLSLSSALLALASGKLIQVHGPSPTS